MLYPGIEKAIQGGLAQYKTFVHAVGGTGRIPCPKGSFIIITGFDYFHFVDAKGTGALQAQMIFQFTGDEGGGNDLTFQISGSPAIPPSITFAEGDPTQALTDFQNMLDTFFPGFTASLFYDARTKLWTIVVTTTTPGTAYNGITPLIILDPVAGDLSVSPFAGGQDNSLTKQAVLDASSHQLEFRSITSRNNFVVYEDVQFYSTLGVRAISTFTITYIGGFTLKWSEGGNPDTAIVGFNPGDPVLTADNFRTALVTAYPGFSLDSLTYNAITHTWVATISSPAPGSAYNGITPVLTTPAGVDPVVTPFAGGTDDQLLWNVRGHFHRDCYLVHLESIKISIAKIPTPDSWTSVNYSALTPKAQEDKSPVGYGTGAGGFNSIRQVVLSPGENYLPLQNEFENLVQTGSAYWRPDIISGRELSDPTANNFPGSNGRNYPLINIEYVLVKRTANDFVLPS